ncbi:MAG: ABC transporter ATP-binding protein [Nocardioidaceae bacterium]
MGELLRIENLRTWFHTRSGVVRAVDGVDLTVDEGQTLCLVGESGCGKSVTAHSIMRLIDRPGRIEADSRVIFRGQNLLDMSTAEVRRIRGSAISMIFQEPMSSLNPLYTVGAQVAEAAAAHGKLSRREAMAAAIDLLQMVGIPSPGSRAAEYPHQMSGGMRQRVMIAMALANEPQLLIADEPTTALDVTIQAQILDLLESLRDRLQMAILLITHDLGVVAEMADDVNVMYAGRIVERGPVSHIFDRPQHPYTEALLHSMPVLGMTQDDPLKVIRGIVPSPLAWAPGCRFAPRCDYAFDRCDLDPPLFPAGPQQVACWLCEAGPRRLTGDEVTA